MVKYKTISTTIRRNGKIWSMAWIHARCLTTRPYGRIVVRILWVLRGNIPPVIESALEYRWWHYSDVIMVEIASQITSLPIVFLTVYSGAGQRKHQGPASLVSVRGIHRSPVNSPHKGPVTRKMFPFDNVMIKYPLQYAWHFLPCFVVAVSTVPVESCNSFASFRRGSQALGQLFFFSALM